MNDAFIDAISIDLANGMSQAQAAVANSCSVRSVQRAARAARAPRAAKQTGNVLVMPKRSGVKPGMYVVGADMHFPEVHWPTWNAMLDFIRRTDVAGYIDLGDVFDNACISPHNRNKAFFKPTGSYAKETAQFDKKILTPLEQSLPSDALRVMITGNHSRWETDFVEEHPEFEGTIERFEALKLEERGWQIVPLGKHFELGKLVLIHGDQLATGYASMYPAKKCVEILRQERSSGSHPLAAELHQDFSHRHQRALDGVCVSDPWHNQRALHAQQAQRLGQRLHDHRAPLGRFVQHLSGYCRGWSVHVRRQDLWIAGSMERTNPAQASGCQVDSR